MFVLQTNLSFFSNWKLEHTLAMPLFMPKCLFHHLSPLSTPQPLQHITFLWVIFFNICFFHLGFIIYKVTVSHNVKVSFHVGFRQHFIVLVFCLLSLFGSGMSLSFTYGSDRPFGSIGTKFLPSLTKKHKQHICTLQFQSDTGN